MARILVLFSTNDGEQKAHYVDGVPGDTEFDTATLDAFGIEAGTESDDANDEAPWWVLMLPDGMRPDVYTGTGEEPAATFSDYPA